MRIQRDYTNTNEAGDFSPAPAGVYRMKVHEVEEGKTKNEDPKAVVTAKVGSGAFRGKQVRHTVTFMDPASPGAGFAKHWLRVIGQPFEGKVTVDTDKWAGIEFIARLSVEDYQNKNGEDRKKNVIEECWNLKDEDAPELGETPGAAPKSEKKWPQSAPKEYVKDESEVPF